MRTTTRWSGSQTSMLADRVGVSAATLMPLVDAIRSYVFVAERIHADDTTVFGRLYEANRKGGPIIEARAGRLAGASSLTRLIKAPIAAEAVKRVDVLFAIEREISSLTAQEHLRLRQERSRPLIVELEAWLREQRAKLSRSNDTAKAVN